MSKYYIIGHMAELPKFKKGDTIKKNEVIGLCGGSPFNSSGGYVYGVHVHAGKGDGNTVEDFFTAKYNGKNDPSDLVNILRISGLQMENTFGYGAQDGYYYSGSKYHNGIDDGKVNNRSEISCSKDLKVHEVSYHENQNSVGGFGNYIIFEILEEKDDTNNSGSSSNSSKDRIKAVRSGKSSDNGTFYFDEKYSSNFDFKNLILLKDTYDLNGDKWLKNTTWTSLKIEGSNETGSSSNSAKKLDEYYYENWKKDSSIVFKSDDEDLVKETNTSKYGSGAYRLIKDKSGWKKDTRFR